MCEPPFVHARSRRSRSLSLVSKLPRCNPTQTVACSTVTPEPDWKQLAAHFEGELYFDDLMRKLYATDASVYREMPQAVALPKNEEGICKLLPFARRNRPPFIPRTVGPSVAGTC